jgi:putative acetyltransferase
VNIQRDDLSGREIQALIAQHLRGMHEITPAESVHALDLDALRRPEITFWSVWQGGELLGCGALKELDPAHGEIKSMRTVAKHRRKRVAARLLHHIVEEARLRFYRRLSLETGAPEAFIPARSLYSRFGFVQCGPFADYGPDPNSIFMTLELQETR